MAAGGKEPVRHGLLCPHRPGSVSERQVALVRHGQETLPAPWTHRWAALTSAGWAYPWRVAEVGRDQGSRVRCALTLTLAGLGFRSAASEEGRRGGRRRREPGALQEGAVWMPGVRQGNTGRCGTQLTFFYGKPQSSTHCMRGWGGGEGLGPWLGCSEPWGPLTRCSGHLLCCRQVGSPVKELSLVSAWPRFATDVARVHMFHLQCLEPGACGGRGDVLGLHLDQW